jgi:hypothetical protein
VNKQKYIYDRFRKKNVVFTPEEWVRQHLACYLTINKKFPVSLIALEVGLEVNNLKKRADIVVYDRYGKPLLLAECKAPEVNITQAVFDQICIYNLSLKVPYLLITNGLQHFFCKIDVAAREYGFIEHIPEYGLLL